MARPPTPTNLKLLKGTDQPCRINKSEPKPKSNKVKMPSTLSDEAKKCWKTVSKELTAAGVLTNMDVHALCLYCEAYARWMQANKEIQDSGAVITTDTGYPIQSPWMGISNKAFDQMKSMLTEFGMTPSSRTKVSSSNVETGDPLDDYMKKGRAIKDNR